jgi:hypothetical protein
MKGILLACLMIVSFCGFAQSKLPGIDKSPLDISYYPVNYPLLKIQDKVTEPLIARVIFSRPEKNKRLIFGELIEYGKVWRLGANEATEIEFYQNVKVNNVRLKKGRYTLYAIPHLLKWTIIFNKENDTWGSFKYDEKKDVLRVDIPVQKQTVIIEHFVMAFDKINAGFTLTMAWDDQLVSLPMSL